MFATFLAARPDLGQLVGLCRIDLFIHPARLGPRDAASSRVQDVREFISRRSPGRS